VQLQRSPQAMELSVCPMNGNPPEHHPQTRFQINTNTGVSVGIIVLLFAGFFTIMRVLDSMSKDITSGQTSLAAVKAELISRIDKNEARITAMEGSKNSVTGVEFYKWAIHLQQSNPSIKVPEPEVSK